MLAMAKPKGRKLFKAFLRRNRISNAKAGEALGVSGTTVFFWTRDENPFDPTPVNAAAIEAWTGGEVPASSWHETKHVVPFAARG